MMEWGQARSAEIDRDALEADLVALRRSAELAPLTISAQEQLSK